MSFFNTISSHLEQGFESYLVKKDDQCPLPLFSQVTLLLTHPSLPREKFGWSGDSVIDILCFLTACFPFPFSWKQYCHHHEVPGAASHSTLEPWWTWVQAGTIILYPPGYSGWAKEWTWDPSEPIKVFQIGDERITRSFLQIVNCKNVIPDLPATWLPTSQRSQRERSPHIHTHPEMREDGQRQWVLEGLEPPGSFSTSFPWFGCWFLD